MHWKASRPSMIWTLLLGILLLPAAAHAVVYQVDDDGVDCPNADFSTIQAAVDEAALNTTRDKIRICPGTYAENVTIGTGNSVILLGAGVGSTVVTGVGGTAGPIIGATASKRVDIRDLTVDGGSAMAGGTVYGIRLDDTDGRIKDVEVLNVRNGDGSSQGVGIRAESTGFSMKVLVLNTLVDNYTRAGINGNGAGLRMTVVRSTVTSPAAPQVWAPNGIQISRGAIGRVVQSTVQGPTSPNPPNGAGSGIIIYCAGERTKIVRNSISGADLGLSVADTKKGKFVGNDITDSVFEGISLQYLGDYFGDLGCPGHPASIEGNLIASNRISGSGDTGIGLENYDYASNPNTPNDNRIVGNIISSSAIEGIHIWSGIFDASENPSDNQVRSNRISGSGTTDAVDDTVGAETADTANIWTSNNCTTSSPDGLCN